MLLQNRIVAEIIAHLHVATKTRIPALLRSRVDEATYLRGHREVAFGLGDAIQCQAHTHLRQAIAVPGRSVEMPESTLVGSFDGLQRLGIGHWTENFAER